MNATLAGTGPKARGRESRPHVLFLNRSYAPDPTSTGQLLAELAGGLAADFRVSVIAGHPVNGAAGGSVRLPDVWRAFEVESEVVDGVEVYRCGLRTFPKASLGGRIASYLLYFLAACAVLVRIPKADLIVAWTDPPIIGLIGLACRLFRRQRFAVIVQDVFPEVALLMDGFRPGLSYRVLDFLSRRTLQGADCVVAIGETMRERLIERKGVPRSKVAVIHNWEDTSRRHPVAHGNQFAAEHDLLDQFVLMHAGNLGLSQELDSLVEAAHLLRSVPNLTFVFLGDGVRRSELMRRAEALGLRNVRFLPHIPKERLNEPYGAADVFLVSLKRGLAGFIVPSKLYGILAAGRAYVAAVEDECEVSNVTRRFECGLVAAPGNPRDIAEKILVLYRDRNLCSRFGANARLAAYEFDLAKQLRAYRRLFLRLIQRDRAEKAFGTTEDPV